ncbi:SGNH/GDSL hydrolase family protein [Acinetobacter sichuanensis]|uniref:SGNH/GDSL hydrolase family protein n=1 Tax=Acinetobacter sichuanensis TaxID=2136183 RepID=A0A371YR01_9GAMM|nr:SGNH/GDSL hydrolase family protein [Acinetobacter sichuanensis]RFC83906.1 SGNH/GDSL hydrolase family protein [Acinetobacter sichuanensis]
MFNRPIDVLCSPVLLAQGLYTLLSVSGRLAEPLGARKGVLGNAELKPLRILITGDSAAAGVGVDQQVDALAGQIVHHLQDTFYCEWELHAKSGFTSKDIYQYLDIMPQCTFDIAVVSIGANDVTKPLLLSHWSKRLNALHQIFKDKFAVKYMIYTSLPPMHLFPAIPQPLRYFLGETARQFNDVLNKKFAEQKDSTVLSIDIPFDAAYMATDGYHPSAAGYQIWAASVAELVKNMHEHKFTPSVQNEEI